MILASTSRHRLGRRWPRRPRQRPDSQVGARRCTFALQAISPHGFQNQSGRAATCADISVPKASRSLRCYRFTAGYRQDCRRDDRESFAGGVACFPLRWMRDRRSAMSVTSRVCIWHFSEEVYAKRRMTSAPKGEADVKANRRDGRVSTQNGPRGQTPVHCHPAADRHGMPARVGADGCTSMAVAGSGPRMRSGSGSGAGSILRRKDEETQ